MVVLDHLALLVALGRGRQAAAAEGDPLGVAVEQLALIGGSADDAPQFDRSKVAEQEVCQDGPAQLPECEVEPVLTAVGGEPAQDGGWQQPPGANRKGDAQHVRRVRLDQRPVDSGGEQAVEMLVSGGWGGGGQGGGPPAAGGRGELDGGGGGPAA